MFNKGTDPEINILKINDIQAPAVHADCDRVLEQVRSLDGRRRHLLEEQSHILNELRALDQEINQLQPDIQAAINILREYMSNAHE